jgi:hypothetical protein
MHRRDFEAEMAKLDKELEEFGRWEAQNPAAGDWAYGKLAGATVNSVYTGMETMLDDLRGFRHAGRRRYGSEIDPERARHVLHNARQAAPLFRQEMALAITALEEVLAVAEAERLESRKAESRTKRRSG